MILRDKGSNPQPCNYVIILHIIVPLMWYAQFQPNLIIFGSLYIMRIYNWFCIKSCTFSFFLFTTIIWNIYCTKTCWICITSKQIIWDHLAMIWHAAQNNYIIWTLHWQNVTKLDIGLTLHLLVKKCSNKAEIVPTNYWNSYMGDYIITGP